MAFRALTSSLVSHIPPSSVISRLSGYGRSQQRRTFIGGLIKKIRQELEQNKDIQEQVTQLKDHIEHTPGLKKAVGVGSQVKDNVVDAAQKARVAAQSGISTTAEVGGKVFKTAGTRIAGASEKVGEAFQKTGASAAAHKTAGTIRQAASVVTENPVAQSIGKAVRTVHQEVTKEGTVFPDPPPRRAIPKATPAETAETAESEVPNDGPSAITATRLSTWDKTWKFMEDMENSANPFVRNTFALTNNLAKSLGSFGDRIFKENDLSIAVKEAKSFDPHFSVEAFMRHVKRTIPIVIKAVADGDVKLLQKYTDKGAWNMLKESLAARRAVRYTMETRLLDLKNVELHSGKYEDERVRFVVTFRTQQTTCIRDRNGKLLEGDPDDIRAVYSVWVFSHSADLEDEIGWKVVEMATVMDQSSW